MIKKWNLTISRFASKGPRRAYVYLPDNWRDDPEQRYPVLYMFDGHNVFFDEDATYGKSWGMAAYLEETQLPIIIAAVECDRSPTNGRLSEYSPFTFEDDHFGHVNGQGKATMEWLVRAFKPMIDRRYPTLPDQEHTFIAGSSMGGLMALYAVTKYNRTFSRAAALSPSLWVAPWKLDRLVRYSSIAPGTVVYMDYGSEEFDYQNHDGMDKNFSRMATRLMEKRVMLTTRIIPGGSHCEASWEQQIPFFMETLLYGLD